MSEYDEHDAERRHEEHPEAHVYVAKWSPWIWIVPALAIFFVGYADPDTPGGRLKAARPEETFIFSASAGEVTRRCEIQDRCYRHIRRGEALDRCTCDG